MQDCQVRHLPVLDGGLIAGIISIRDVLGVLVEDADEPEVVVLRPGTKVMLVGD
jgi:CBS domain-containing protein